MAKKKKPPEDVQDAQTAAAEELQRQIDAIVHGEAPASPPGNLRDFIAEKMAERAKKK